MNYLFTPQKNGKNAILFIAFLLLFCIKGSSLYAQTPKYNNITLQVENENIEKVFNILSSQTDIKFFYDQKVLNNTPRVLLKITKGTLQQVLTEITAQTQLHFNRTNNTITVSSKKGADAQPTSSKNTRLLTVSGKVIDSEGEPAVGATILVKGTTNGTSAGLDGQWSLSNVPENATIVISMIGYVSMEFRASDKALTNIVLKDDSEMLAEVVVVGYGTQKRANLTGAVATISAEDVNNRPVSSAAGALQGADPSVNLTFSTGSLDSDYSIDIRGVASINGGTPLVLCDGMEVSLNQINPNDIESISILKDASASAIYGAKASSGVILITTKSGKNQAEKSTSATMAALHGDRTRLLPTSLQPVTTM